MSHSAPVFMGIHRILYYNPRPFAIIQIDSHKKRPVRPEHITRTDRLSDN